MSTAPPEVPYRRIGSILVERGLISDAELARALAEQDSSGRLLGEILVSSFGVTRVDLADALAEQWQEANRTHTDDPGAADSNGAGHITDENDLRVLLDEAEAARAELEIRTEELSRRLATLEGVVSEVTSALAELRDVTPNGNGHEPATAQPRAARRRHNGRR
jgi:hypothetical protein